VLFLAMTHEDVLLLAADQTPLAECELLAPAKSCVLQFQMIIVSVDGFKSNQIYLFP